RLGLLPIKAIPELPERKQNEPVETLSGVIEAIQDLSWNCSGTGWTFLRQKAHEALLHDKKLRDEFIEFNGNLSAANFSNILLNYKTGRVGEEELFIRLEAFQSEYLVTEEAFQAREILTS